MNTGVDTNRYRYILNSKHKNKLLNSRENFQYPVLPTRIRINLPHPISNDTVVFEEKFFTTTS